MTSYFNFLTLPTERSITSRMCPITQRSGDVDWRLTGWKGIWSVGNICHTCPASQRHVKSHLCWATPMHTSFKVGDEVRAHGGGFGVRYIMLKWFVIILRLCIIQLYDIRIFKIRLRFEREKFYVFAFCFPTLVYRWTKLLLIVGGPV